MNTLKTQLPRKHDWSLWSVLRKAHIIGAAAGAVITTFVIVLAALFHPSVFSMLGQTAMVMFQPAFVIAKTCGVSLAWFNNAKTGNPAIIPSCFVVITNSCLGFLVGSLFNLLRKLKHKLTQISL